MKNLRKTDSVIVKATDEKGWVENVYRFKDGNKTVVIYDVRLEKDEENPRYFAKKDLLKDKGTCDDRVLYGHYVVDERHITIAAQIMCSGFELSSIDENKVQTTCYRAKDCDVYIGYAICCKEDRFNPSVGKKVAYHRAKKNWDLVLRYDYYHPLTDDEISAVMRTRACKIANEFKSAYQFAKMNPPKRRNRFSEYPYGSIEALEDVL